MKILVMMLFLVLLLPYTQPLTPDFASATGSGNSNSYVILLQPPFSKNIAALSQAFDANLRAIGVDAGKPVLFGGIGVGGIFNLTSSELSVIRQVFHPYLVIQDRPVFLQSSSGNTSPLLNWSYFPGGPYSGTDIKVAVIDTGIDTSLSALGPSFASRVVGSYNLVNPGSPPNDTDGHGTAVASIIGADSTNFTGVAPGVQLLIYKVFKGNETTSNLLVEALDQAAQDGASVINLILGGGLDAGTLWQLGYLLNQRGIELVAAVGNDGPDLGTLSIPAALPYFLSVGASTSQFSNQPVAELLLGSNFTFDTAQPMEFSPLTNRPVQGSYVFVRSATPAEIAGVDLSGKIAVTLRDHKTTFADMEQNVSEAGAIGLVVVNDENSSFLGTLQTNSSTSPSKIPVVSVAYQEGYRLLNSDPNGTVLRMGIFIPHNPYPAPFSSRGPGGPFLLKPELMAPGDSVPVVTFQGVGLESGTSFSAPQVTGALALITQEHPGLSPDQYYSILELSASQLHTNEIDFPPYVQGAGELNISKALATPFTVSPGDFIALYPYTGGSYSDTIHVSFFANTSLKVSYIGEYPLTLNTSYLDQTESGLTVTASPSSGGQLMYDRLIFSTNNMNFSFPVMVEPSAVGVIYNMTTGSLQIEGGGGGGYIAQITYPDGTLHSLTLDTSGGAADHVGTPMPGFYFIEVQPLNGNGSTGEVGFGMFYIGSVTQSQFPGYTITVLAGYSAFLCLVAFAIYLNRWFRIRRGPRSAVRPPISAWKPPSFSARLLFRTCGLSFRS